MQLKSSKVTPSPSLTPNFMIDTDRSQIQFFCLIRLWQIPHFFNSSDMRKCDQGSEEDNPTHFNRKKFVAEKFQSLENRLRELSSDLQKIKKDFAEALLIQESDAPPETLLQ